MPGRYGYPREARINNQRAYESVFQGGRKLAGPAFVCYLSRQPGVGARLGVVVSRKVGGAVVRNRVKRFVREYFRLHREALAPDTQLVIVARAPAASFTCYAESAQALESLLARARVLRA